MTPITAGIYCRVSKMEQNLPPQLNPCRKWCETQGIVYEEYLDKISGGKQSRPALDKLMADVKSGAIQLIVCHKLDRLGRSFVHLAQMIELFRKLDVALIVTDQGIDTRNSNAMGRMQMNMLMVFAELERDMIRERTLAGLAAAKAQGRKGGRRPGSGQWEAPKGIGMLVAGMGYRKAAMHFKVSPMTLRKAILREKVAA